MSVALDLFAKIFPHASSLTGPGSGGASVTPDDNNDLPTASREIRVGSAGDLKVTYINGDVVVIPAMLAGEKIAARVKRIWATGTGAGSITIQY